MDGTELDRLKSTRLGRNNTTGVKGVYLIQGKYVAKLGFRNRQYVLSQYAAWKAKTDTAPDWARENPGQIRVVRNADSSLGILFCSEIK